MRRSLILSKSSAAKKTNDNCSSNQEIIMAHPTSVSSLSPKITSTPETIPKTMMFKIIGPQTLASVVTPTTSSTQYLITNVPVDILHKSSSSKSQTVTHNESPSTNSNSTTSSMQHMPAIVPSLDSSNIDSDDEKKNANVFDKNGHFIWNHKMIMLFFTEYEQHEVKLKKRKYQSKEAMFQAIAESFKQRGYVNATKNHMKNKFKLLKKKWDKYILRTKGKNSSGKGIKPLSYEKEMINIFGKSHSRVPPFVVGRKEIVSQQDILQKVSQTLPENENEEQSIEACSPLSPLSTVSNKPSSVNSDKSFTTISNCSFLTNTKAKVRDDKLALTLLQSIKESICTTLEKETDAKQDVCTKILTELKKCNELQKERNIILQKQLQILEKMAERIYPMEKELSDED